MFDWTYKKKHALKKLLEKSSDKEMTDEGNSILQKNGFAGANGLLDFGHTRANGNKESAACIIV